MTGLVPVIHVVKPPESLRIGRKRSRVDGRDEPGHDGEARLNLMLALCHPYNLLRRDFANVSNATASTMITPITICWM
jgi:hypothetical protein